MSNADSTNRLERVTNTLLENIWYFSTREVNGKLAVGITTVYNDGRYIQEGLGINIDAAKRNACQKIAERIIEGTD